MGDSGASCLVRDPAEVSAPVRYKSRTGAWAERVVFDGSQFVRYPGSRPYFAGWYRGRRWLLHRAIWTYHNGPIPEGHVVHHSNGNTRDNRLSNLELLTPLQHVAHHDSLNSWKWSKRNREHLAKQRAKGYLERWRKTALARAFFKAKGQELRANTVKPTEKRCQNCGAVFIANRTSGVRFCASVQCKRSGRPEKYGAKPVKPTDILLACSVCDAQFYARSRPDALRYCGEACRGRANAMLKRARRGLQPRGEREARVFRQWRASP